MTSDPSILSPATPSDLGNAMLERHKPRRIGAVGVALVAAGAGLVTGMQLGGAPASTPTAAPAHDMQAMPGMAHGSAAPPGAGSQAVYISPASSIR